MNFEELLFQAKMGDEKATEQVLKIYQPLLVKNALVNGVFDEDLYQELLLETLKCINNFRKLE